VWLSPVQAKVIPISKQFLQYGLLVKEKLEKLGLRIDVDIRDETMQAKIRDAEMEKVPYMLVVGKKEKINHAVAVRPRAGNDLGMMKIEEFVERIHGEIDAKK